MLVLAGKKVSSHSLHLFRSYKWRTLAGGLLVCFCYFTVEIPLTKNIFTIIVSHFGVGAAVFTAPDPTLAPSKTFRRLRLRLRAKCVASDDSPPAPTSSSGSSSASLVPIFVSTPNSYRGRQWDPRSAVNFYHEIWLEGCIGPMTHFIGRPSGILPCVEDHVPKLVWPMPVICGVVGVASNDKRTKCWCGTSEVGVAAATPAIRRSPAMDFANKKVRYE